MTEGFTVYATHDLLINKSFIFQRNIKILRQRRRPNPCVNLFSSLTKDSLETNEYEMLIQSNWAAQSMHE